MVGRQGNPEITQTIRWKMVQLPKTLEEAPWPLKIIYVAYFKPHALYFICDFKHCLTMRYNDIQTSQPQIMMLFELLHFQQTSHIQGMERKGSFGLSLFAKS